MKKRLIIIFLIVIPAIFFAIKLKNYFLSMKILGDTVINSTYLKQIPQKKIVDKNLVYPFSMPYSIGNIKFEVPRKDTLITYKVKEIYRSFKFQNNAHLVVYKDSVPFNFFQQLTLIKSTDQGIMKNFNNRNKLSSDFDLLLYTYRRIPSDISFFNISTDSTIVQSTFLKLKIMNLGINSDQGFYFFRLKHVKGFQFGKPGLSDKTIVNLFTKNDDNYTIFASGLNQEEVDYIVNSIDNSIP